MQDRLWEATRETSEHQRALSVLPRLGAEGALACLGRRGLSLAEVSAGRLVELEPPQGCPRDPGAAPVSSPSSEEGLRMAVRERALWLMVTGPAAVAVGRCLWCPLVSRYSPGNTEAVLLFTESTRTLASAPQVVGWCLPGSLQSQRVPCPGDLARASPSGCTFWLQEMSPQSPGRLPSLGQPLRCAPARWPSG